MHKEVAEQKRKAAEDAVEADFVESYKQLERVAYISGQGSHNANLWDQEEEGG